MTAPSVFQYRVALVHDGYAVVDEDGPVDDDRFRTWAAAAARLTEMEGEEIEAARQSRADYIDDHE
jgi:hypothetical protein